MSLQLLFLRQLLLLEDPSHIRPTTNAKPQHSFSLTYKDFVERTEAFVQLLWGFAGCRSGFSAPRASSELVPALFSAPQTCERDSVSRRCIRDPGQRESSCPARIPGAWRARSRSCERRSSEAESSLEPEPSRGLRRTHRRCRPQIRRRSSSQTWKRRWQNHGPLVVMTPEFDSSRRHRKW